MTRSVYACGLLALFFPLYALATPRPVQTGIAPYRVIRDVSKSNVATSLPTTTYDPDTGYADDDDDDPDEFPDVCISGCAFAIEHYLMDVPGSAPGDCADTNSTEACTPACTGTNYAGLVTCLECSVANGEEYMTAANATAWLESINAVCEAASVSGFVPSTTITATPTTTGPFTWDPTGTNPSLPPVWTGFTSYVQEQDSALYSSFTSEFPVSSTSPAATTITSSASASASAYASSSASASSSGATMRHVIPMDWMGAAVVALLVMVAA